MERRKWVRLTRHAEIGRVVVRGAPWSVITIVRVVVPTRLHGTPLTLPVDAVRLTFKVQAVTGFSTALLDGN